MANEEEPQQKLFITDSSKIYEDMSPYYLKETFSDIQLILSDKTLHAHKIVLAARCKYFESLLLQDPKQTQIELINVPSKAFETILYYIYTEINLLKRDAFPVQEIDVFKIASDWCKINEDLDNLVIECVRFPCLTRNEILNVVWPSKVVNNEKLLKVLTTIENNGTKETQRYVSEQFEGKNLTTAKYNVKVISGLNTTMLFEATKNDKDGAYHNEDDKNGITVDLAGVKCFNHITMNIRNWWIGYSIEISTDLQKWHNVIDYSRYKCEYNQNLYFEQQKARYIRIVLESSLARIGKFQVYMSRNVPTIHNQIVCPSSNVITSETDIDFWETSPGSFTTRLFLNQPYMISRIKVRLQFYKSISSIGISSDGDLEEVELPKHQNLLLRFNKRIVIFIRIIGKLSPNKTANDYKQFLEDIECL
ncbi:BTB/POZ domain-containing protein 9-like [Zophobas morio]|uniref:BTB/POZ domain-containing protein 9-like n=1 Tax=Zophobas morio TaxID=2755281 RepID=UPI003083B870